MSYKEVPVAEEYEMEEIESGLTFVGLTGMIDPARVEVSEAIKVTHHAGIKNSDGDGGTQADRRR